MKPVSTYLSLSQAGNKVRLLLLICLLAQVFYFSIKEFKVPLPAKLIEVSIASIISEDIRVEINQPYIVGLSKIEFEGLLIKSKETILLQAQDLSLSLRPAWPSKDPLALINQIEVSSATFLPDQRDKNHWGVSEFSLNHHYHDNSLFLKTSLELGEIRTELNFEVQNIDQLHKNNWGKKRTEEHNLEDLTESLISMKESAQLWTRSFPPIHTNFQGRINHNGGKIYISQKESLGKNTQKIEDFLTVLSWDFQADNHDLINYKFQSQAEKLMLNTKSSNIAFSYPLIRGSGIGNIARLNLLSANSSFTYKNLSLSGVISGNLPPVDFNLNQDISKHKVHVYSDTNGTKISLHAEKDTGGWKANGLIKLVPRLHDIHAQLPQGNLRMIDGKELYISLLSNPTPTRVDSPIQFFVSADHFSALQTPPGKFQFTGEIKQDFSIFINDAYGKLGQSEVTGTYYQKWNPAKYRFLLNGSCYPPDIDNWLGIWWPPLWQDFTFSTTIPVGDFSVEGIWAGQSGNSVTIGQVKTNDVTFRNFPFDSGLVDIRVDHQATQLSGKKMRHQYGSLDGSLLFPRSLNNSNLFLSFSLNGDFPVNEAKGILGKEVEESLSELNVTSIYCEADGEIFKENEIESVDNNLTWYDLYLSADEPFSYAGIDVEYVRGKISSLNGLTTAKFDDFGLAEGQGKLSFAETSPFSDSISITMDLKNASRQKLFENLSNSSQWEKHTSPQNVDQLSGDSVSKQEAAGKINLSMQVEGPGSDPKYFEGTGNLVLHDVDIGSIHLLGGIRNKLGAFNLPLPSDALNFNKLVVPFALEHDRVIFDRANLSGPLSKFEAFGEVNWVKQEVDLLADFKLAGNLNIPVLKQIVNLADPLSKLSKLKIQGDWENPDWSIYLGARALNP